MTETAAKVYDVVIIGGGPAGLTGRFLVTVKVKLGMDQ